MQIVLGSRGGCDAEQVPLSVAPACVPCVPPLAALAVENAKRDAKINKYCFRN